MFKKILAPLDRSELSLIVLDTALAVADKFGAELVLLRIESQAAALDQEVVDQEMDYLEREVRDLLALGVSRGVLPAERIRAEVRAGDLVGAIGWAAEELRVDLVVMGTHGRHGWVEQFTGSTSEQVVARLPVSTMVVKPAGFPYLRD